MCRSTYIQRVFDVMRRAHWHRFQVLTKRAERLAELSPADRLAAERLDGRERRERRLRRSHRRPADDRARTSSSSRSSRCSGRCRSWTCADIDWVIVGGESGPGARPMDPEWVTDIRDQCRRAGVAVLLQAVGRHEQEEGRAPPRRTDLGRDAGARRCALRRRHAPSLVARDGVNPLRQRCFALAPPPCEQAPPHARGPSPA